MSGTANRAALVAALLVCGLVPVSAQAAADAVRSLPGGVASAVHPDPTQASAAVALWYRAPAAGFADTPIPGLSRLAASTVAASSPITGTPLGRLVEHVGGRISVQAYPDSVAVTAIVPPDQVAAVVRAMTADYFAPVLDEAGLEIAQRDVAEDALYRSYDPPEAIEDALGAALFDRGPLHIGTIPVAKSVAAITLGQVRSFAERAFRPANATLVLTGNVDPQALSAVAQRQGAKLTPESAATQLPRPSPAPLERQANVDGTGLGWTGPPIADETAATALDFVADMLFAPRTGSVQRALGNRKATVTGKFVTYHDPGVFLVTIAGPDAAAVRPDVERAIAAAATPMAAPAFVAARAGFVYHLLSDMETPAELADTYGWYTVEGNPVYAPAEGGEAGRYFSIAQGLSPEIVARTVARYLTAPAAVVTLVKSTARRT